MITLNGHTYFINKTRNTAAANWPDMEKMQNRG